jgi:predicted ATP-dependent endonuclease of OLD family
VNKAKEDKKRIWEQIEGYLPMYALFQSDRSSRDSDDEVQNPMKAAIATAIAEVQDDIKRIQDKVRTKAEEIAQNTHRELAIIDATLASELTPNFTPPTPAKWTGLFSVGLDTDSGIPLNKRGSGIRRLVLISFFKAEAERRLTKSPTRGIIYAIEEPETSQHYNNQIILIDSLKTLSEEQNCQVLLTTHSPGLAAELPTESIRFIKRDKNRKPIIERGSDVFEEVAESLGVTPDSRVKILLCVEGPTDVLALKCLSRALHEADNALPDLSTDTRIAFVPLGGSTLSHWVNNHYLKALHLPEVHIYDGDKSVYQKSIDEVNKESNGSWGVLTKKHEIENYLHPQAISEAFGVNVEIKDFPTNGKGVPTLFAEALSEKNGSSQKLKDNNAKIKLAEKAFPKMTAEWIRERDPLGEIKGWLQNIAKLL